MYVKNGKRTIQNKYYKIENRKQQHTSTDIEKQKEHNTTKQKQKSNTDTKTEIKYGNKNNNRNNKNKKQKKNRFFSKPSPHTWNAHCPQCEQVMKCKQRDNI